MMNGWNGDRSGVNLPVQVSDGSQRFRPKLGCHVSRTLGVAVHNSNQLHAGSVLLKLSVDPCMIATEGAATHNSNANARGSGSHSKKRNFRMCHTAATPSRQVIFLPSS